MTTTLLAPPTITARSRRRRNDVATVAVISVFFVMCYSRVLVGRGILWCAPAIFIALLQRERVARLRVSGILCAFTGWIGFCSVLAGLPKGSFMLLLLVGAILTGAVLGTFGLEAVGRGLLAATGLTVTVSVILSAGDWWNHAREPDPIYAGAWKGLFNQKNGLAFTAALLIVLCIAHFHTLPRFVARAMFVIGAIALFASHGMSAVAALSYPLALFAMSAAKRRRGKPLAFRQVVALTAALVVAILWVLPAALAGLGRDPTLTGRTIVWHTLWHDAKTMLTYGHGVGAYWFQAAAQPSLNSIFQTLHFRPGQAHNGALEVVLDAGIPGLLLLAGLVYVATRRALRELQHGITWPLLVLAFAAMMTITERGLYSAQGLMIIAAIVSAPEPRRNAPVHGDVSPAGQS